MGIIAINIFTYFSFRLQETLDRLSAKLESVYVSSGGKKMNIITHSMGGLLVKCFMCLHSDVRILFAIKPTVLVILLLCK